MRYKKSIPLQTSVLLAVSLVPTYPSDKGWETCKDATLKGREPHPLISLYIYMDFLGEKSRTMQFERKIQEDKKSPKKEKQKVGPLFE